MVGDSWTHKIARVCILPLVNTPITPNHLTTIRLISGIAACPCLAVGERSWDILGGWLWLFSSFLDRADGELARVSGKASSWGHSSYWSNGGDSPSSKTAVATHDSAAHVSYKTPVNQPTQPLQ